MRFALLVSLTLAVPLAASTTESPVKKVFPYEVHVESLDNGLKAILVPMSSGGLVAYWTVVRTGSRDEFEEGHTGFAHFFEHMMFRGTERYPGDVYNRILTGLGADTNAYTTDDLTAYHLGIAAEDVERVMELESDRFRNLSYPEPDFRTEAGAVYGEYRKSRMSPGFRLYEALLETAYDRHTYGHTTMGYERDIRRMPEMYEYSRSFFSRYYRPDNVVVLIVGDIEPASTMERLREYYGGWEAGYVEPAIPEEPAQQEPRRVEVSYEGRTLPWVVQAYKTDEYGPEDRRYLAVDLLGELAFGSTSEIHKKLVLEEQVVEFFGAGQTPNRDAGLFTIWTRIKDGSKVDYVEEEIERTLARYREQPPDAGRLADLKSRLRYDFLMGLDTPDRVASALARTIAITGGIDAVDRQFATYSSIEPEDVRAAAEHYLVPQRRTVAVLREDRP